MGDARAAATSTSPSRTRPRPPARAASGGRLEARRAAFLSAAWAVFEEKGFDGATIDEVIARSGGSRQTLYALFGDKQGLFEALVVEVCETIFRGLAPEALGPQPLEEALTEIGERYLLGVTSRRALSLHRLMISEAARVPKLAERFWRRGPGAARVFLAQFLEARKAEGRIVVDDGARAADHFLDMLTGTIRQQCLIGARKPPGRAEARALVASAVTQFLRGAAPRPAGA